MPHLLDTNIISELIRPRPDPGVQTQVAGLSRIIISVITVEEIRFGLARNPNQRIQQWMDDFLPRQTILPVTSDIAECAGHLRGQLARQGMVRAQADMLIAATARVHQLILMTRNVRDFSDCGVNLRNPFTT